MYKRQVFLPAFFCCFWLRNSGKAVAFTAGLTFILSLYLGYGMKLGFPVSFLPAYQIRKAVSTQALFLPSCLLSAAVWAGGMLFLSWHMSVSYTPLDVYKIQQYRTAALAGIATQFFWGAMEILTFRAFYQSDPASFPMTLQATSSYIWIQQAFLVLFMGWNLSLIHI